MKTLEWHMGQLLSQLIDNRYKLEEKRKIENKSEQQMFTRGEQR